MRYSVQPAVPEPHGTTPQHVRVVTATNRDTRQHNEHQETANRQRTALSRLQQQPFSRTVRGRTWTSRRGRTRTSTCRRGGCSDRSRGGGSGSGRSTAKCGGLNFSLTKVGVCILEDRQRDANLGSTARSDVLHKRAAHGNTPRRRTLTSSPTCPKQVVLQQNGKYEPEARMRTDARVADVRAFRKLTTCRDTRTVHIHIHIRIHP